MEFRQLRYFLALTEELHFTCAAGARRHRAIPLLQSNARASPLRQILKLWIAHYNKDRPYMALGPGLPDPPLALPTQLRHRHPFDTVRVRARSLLGGPHPEYSLAPA